MLASIYRSNKKDEMYLYLVKKDDFSCVPEALLKAFGQPQFAMQLNLAKREKLSRANINDVKQHLEQDGYFLQMPPAIHSNKADLK